MRSLDFVSAIRNYDWTLAQSLATTDEERRALALPRRQQLELREPNAFLSAAEVRRLPRGHAGAPYENCCPSADQLADKPLKVLSISHGAPRLPSPTLGCRVASAPSRTR